MIKISIELLTLCEDNILDHNRKKRKKEKITINMVTSVRLILFYVIKYILRTITQLPITYIKPPMMIKSTEITNLTDRDI